MYKVSRQRGQTIFLLMVIRMHVIGIDVSKAKLHCHLLCQPHYEKARNRVFSNKVKDFQTLIEWACGASECSISELHVILEATGVYHQALAHWCYDAGATVSVLNPAQLKSFAKGLAVKTKNDQKDAAVLARYGMLLKPRAWQPSPLEVQQLKALLSRLQMIQNQITQERNRLEHSTIANAPSAVIKSISKHLDYLEKEQNNLERLIDQHIDRHPQLKRDQQLLESIPAIGKKTAWRLMSMLRAKCFRSASQAAAYLGLVPVEHQSGSSIQRRARLSKNGDKRLRAGLYMATVVAITHNPDVRALYMRLLAKGQAKMSALCAGMRKLVQIAFGVLKHQTPYCQQTLEFRSRG